VPGWQYWSAGNRHATQAAGRAGRQAGRAGRTGRQAGTFEAEAGRLNLKARLHALAIAAAAAAAAGQLAGTFCQFVCVCPHLQAASQSGRHMAERSG
jgi:hypothetical protein